MLYERTTYLPKAGSFQAVLETRQMACDVRRRLGLPPGEIFVEDTGTGNDLVHWECRFLSKDCYMRDRTVRDESPEFSQVRKQMGTRIDDFQRRVFVRAKRQASVICDTPLIDVPIVPQKYNFVSQNQNLTGYLYLPPGEGPFPCMVMNHGSGIEQGTWDISRPGSAAHFLSWGIAVFLPHRHGYGDSPGRPWRQDVSATFGTADYDEQLADRIDRESNDVVAAQKMLAEMPDIDADHIGVMGSSFGGTVTLLAASKSADFRCAVEFAGAAMNWEKTPGLRKLMTQAARQLTQPIFFAQAANDFSTAPTVELGQALEGTGKTFTAKVYPGFGLTHDEGHFFFGNGAAIWGNDIREFLDQWL